MDFTAIEVSHFPACNMASLQNTFFQVSFWILIKKSKRWKLQPTISDNEKERKKNRFRLVSYLKTILYTGNTTFLYQVWQIHLKTHNFILN
jgi:hypothetical protein